MPSESSKHLGTVSRKVEITVTSVAGLTGSHWIPWMTNVLFLNYFVMNLTRTGFKNRWYTLVYMQSRNIYETCQPRSCADTAHLQRGGFRIVWALRNVWMWFSWENKIRWRKEITGWASNLQNLDFPETTAHVCKDRL